MRIFRMIKETIPQFLGFDEKYNLYCPEKNKMYVKLDWIINLLLSGASAEDYFTYRFFEKSKAEKKKYVTLWDSKWIIRAFNGKGERKWVEDKSLFPVKFSKYMCRESYSVDKLSFEEFYKFYIRSGQVILKPINGFNGNGIFVIKPRTDKNRVNAIYNEIKKKGYVVEEVLTQEGFLRELNPASLNTIRVNAININGDVNIINAILRTGQGDKATDNICAGGCVAEVDISNGEIKSDFYDLSNNVYRKHPKSGLYIKGERIPCWDKVLMVVKDAAKLVPDLGYTSWDIAVIKDCKIAIVEGNSYGTFNLQQITGHGVKEKYMEYLKVWNVNK